MKGSTMSDKAQMPCMREQDKDNNTPVMKNAPAKAELAQERFRSKAEDVREQEENHETRGADKPAPQQQDEYEGCDCSCGCE